VGLRNWGKSIENGPPVLPRTSGIRRLPNSDLATLHHGQQQIQQGQHSQASLLSETNDLLQHLLGRVSKLERAAGIVEQPQAPRPSRNRLFD
jgi:hypothetical protein